MILAGLGGTHLALIAVIVLVAALIRGLTGFGFAILAVPMLGLVIPPAQAVIFAIIMQLLIGPFGVPSALPIIDRRAVMWIGTVAMASTPVGLWILATIPADKARLIIAIIALGCFSLFLKKRAPDPPAHPLALTGTGMVSGVLNGFAAMPGPPVILHFVRDAVPPAVARGSMITIFFATAFAGTLAALWRGMIDQQVALLAALALPIMITGNHIGARFFGRISTQVWRSVVVALLLVSAIGAIARV